MADVLEGEVKWFSSSRGYGFLCPVDAPETEYFVHFSSVMVDGFKTLLPKQKVRFELRETPRGVQAIEVRPL